MVVGYAVSAFGSNLNLLALNLFAYTVTGSAVATGLVMVLRLAAGFTAGLVAGRWVTRYDRKRLMIAADLAQAGALLVLVATPPAQAGAVLYGVAVVAGACATVNTVALRSSVPEMVGADRRAQANALLVTGRSLGMVGGLAVAGILVGWGGFRAAFLVDAVTFVVSAANLARLPLLTRVDAPSTDHADPDGAPVRRGGSWWTAVVLLGATPVLPAMILVRALDAFGSSSHMVGMPIYATLVRPEQPAVFLSQFWAAWAVGNLATQQVVVRAGTRRGWTPGERAFAVGTCVMSALFIAAFTGIGGWVLVAVAALAGLADGFTETSYTSRLQAVPDDRRGGLFGVAATAETFGLGTGMLLSAVLLEQLAPPTVVGLLHGGVVVLGVLFLVYATVARWRVNRVARHAT